jgi:predicted DNA-binding transcriptional regulator AlpA
MEINTERLVRFSTYADMKGVKRQWIYQLAEQDKLNWIEIDGVKFVIL